MDSPSIADGRFVSEALTACLNRNKDGAAAEICAGLKDAVLAFGASNRRHHVRGDQEDLTTSIASTSVADSIKGTSP
jgi:hypothetical protein